MKKRHGNAKYTIEELRQEALKYRTRGEFILKGRSFYGSARTIGREFLNEICSHMITINFSIPQLMCRKILESVLKTACSYNDKTTLNGLELDIYFPEFKLALEYNGMGWHQKPDTIKRDKKKKDLCRSMGIALIVIEQDRTPNEYYERDVKAEIINYLDQIQQSSGLKISEQEVLDVDCSTIFDEVALLNYRNLETIDHKIQKCCSIIDFKQKYRNEYEYLKAGGKTHLLECLRTRPNKVSDEEVLEACLKFSSLSELRKENNKMYDLCKKRKLIEFVSSKLIRSGGQYKNFTDSQLLMAADKMKSKKKLSEPIKRELIKRGFNSNCEEF